MLFSTNTVLTSCNFMVLLTRRFITLGPNVAWKLNFLLVALLFVFVGVKVFIIVLMNLLLLRGSFLRDVT